MNSYKRIPLVALLVLTLGVPLAYAGAIKVWSSYEPLTSSDLNANFAHIHNLMVGGHGARLVNADVSNNAAIATSKLAGGPLIPKAWVTTTSTVCPGTICPIGDSAGVASVIRTGLGVFVVNLSTTRPDVNGGVFVTVRSAGVITVCDGALASTTTIQVGCGDPVTTLPVDAVLSVMLLDND